MVRCTLATVDLHAYMYCTAAGGQVGQSWLCGLRSLASEVGAKLRSTF